jgi:L-aminopeptidase/D-esterase-like protein
VVLARNSAVAGVDVRGGAPGTREIALLDPVNTVQKIHAIVLSGGSAFGLDTASGVMKYLADRGLGVDVVGHIVPIVSAAVLFDLGVSDVPENYPGRDEGYKAAERASSDPVAEGNVGAGAGATVGKLAGLDTAMKGGLGTKAARLPNGVVVAAMIAVNAVGDIIDPNTGQVIAGVRYPKPNVLGDARVLMSTGLFDTALRLSNTTIGVVATNARLTQSEATKVARMAHDGIARAISPAHTPLDGDTLFVLATGDHEADVNLLTVGSIAADVTADAIVRGVRHARSFGNYPSVDDFRNLK